MKVVVLLSGGKDSCYNALECVRYGHKVAALANLFPEQQGSSFGTIEYAFAEDPTAAGEQTIQELDSFMLQTVGHTCIEAIAQCMNVPLFRRGTCGKALQTAVHYVSPPPSHHAEGGSSECCTLTDSKSGDCDNNVGCSDDEVEDLFQLLQDVKVRADVVVPDSSYLFAFSMPVMSSELVRKSTLLPVERSSQIIKESGWKMCTRGPFLRIGPTLMFPNAGVGASA